MPKSKHQYYRILEALRWDKPQPSGLIKYAWYRMHTGGK